MTATVGIGIPGVISPATGLVKNANSIALNGHPFDRDISAALGREVRVENDANCFALSEAADGAGAGLRMVFGVIIGTGCGGGIVVDGRVVPGRHRIAGEWGHNPLPWPTLEEIPGPHCWCGQWGCLETLVAGPGAGARLRRARRRATPAASRPAPPPASSARAGGAGPPRRPAGARAGAGGRTCSIPTRSCWAAGCRTWTHLYEQCRG